MGQIVTFYSYKGGVGRSMSLANVAVLLAGWGHKVLVVDFDLEAPGLENFFARSIDPDLAKENSGVVDLLSDAMATGIWPGIEGWLPNTIEIKLPGSRGHLRLLTAGDRSGSEYFRRVQQLDFREFYAVKQGGVLLEGFRDELKAEFDFVLVDSRTGLTDIGGFCTVQLPDLIVLLFTPTKQALAGGIDIVSRAAKARQRLPFERPVVPVLPVPSRLDVSAEFRLGQQWLDTFARDLADIFADWLPRTMNLRTMLELLKLPHIPFFSYGESLPVLEQGTVDPTGLGYAYETLAALVAHDVEGVETLTSDRTKYVHESSGIFYPSIERTDAEVFVRYSYSGPDESLFREFWSHLSPLMSAGVSVIEANTLTPRAEWVNMIPSSAIVVLLVSADYLALKDAIKAELPALVAAAERGLRIFPVIVRKCLWEPPLAKFQVVNPKSPIASEKDRDSAWTAVVKKIAQAVGERY